MVVEQGVSERGVELWKGGVQQSECDQMGHMNVAFYLAKASEALGGLAAALGLPRAFRAGGETTLIIRDQHVRFLREAHFSAPLLITGGIVELEESDARVLMLLHHDDGSLAATFQLVVGHVDARTRGPRPWPQAVRSGAEQLRVEVPSAAAARSCTLDPVDPQRLSLERALALDLPRTSLGLIQPGECDMFGRLRPEALLTRIFEGAVHLGKREPKEKRSFDPSAGLGGAAVEYRLVYFDLPAVGQLIEVRSGFSSVGPKVRHLVYWVLDVETGRACCLADSVVVSFDLNTRKIITLEGEALAAAQAAVVPGLELWATISNGADV